MSTLQMIGNLQWKCYIQSCQSCFDIYHIIQLSILDHPKHWSLKYMQSLLRCRLANNVHTYLTSDFLSQWPAIICIWLIQELSNMIMLVDMMSVKKESLPTKLVGEDNPKCHSRQYVGHWWWNHWLIASQLYIFHKWKGSNLQQWRKRDLTWL